MKRPMMAIVALSLFAAPAWAQDKDKDKGKISGTWKWSVTVNDQARETTMKLKFDGDKLTGTISGRNNQESPIEDAKFKDGEVSFKVVRDRNGTKTTTTYKGKLSGDSIKGTSTSDRGGEAKSRDWEAKRAAD